MPTETNECSTVRTITAQYPNSGEEVTLAGSEVAFIPSATIYNAAHRDPPGDLVTFFT